MLGPQEREAIARELSELQQQLDGLRRKIRDEGAHARKLTGMVPILACRLGDEEVAFLQEEVESVVFMAKLTSLPEAPAWVVGLLNLHGDGVPVIDVLARTSRRARRPQITDVIVIGRVGERRVGLVVQEILNLDTIDSSQIDRGVLDLTRAPYVLGVTKSHDRQVALFSIAQLWESTDMPEGGP